MRPRGARPSGSRTVTSRPRRARSRGSVRMRRRGSREPALGARMVQEAGSGEVVVGGADAEGLANAAEERSALGVGPRLVDDERVGLARFEGGAGLFARFQARLDPARVEEQGQAGARGVPELFAQLEEGEVDRLSGGVEQVDAVIGLAPAHRRRECQVELEEVFRQGRDGRIDPHERGRRHLRGASRVRGTTIGGASGVRSPAPGSLEGSKTASYVSPRSRANLGRKRTRSSSTR